jgi:RecA-family ATPase
MPLLNFKTAPEWVNYAKTLPDPNMLFDEFWHEGELNFLFSDTNVGKSIVSMQIAQSIASGEAIQHLKMTAIKQKVLLCEFELSEKQFESRLKDKSTGLSFMPSENIIRAVYDFSNHDFKEKTEAVVFHEIKKYLIESKIKVVIIDNITAVQDTGRFEQAINFMQKINRLKFELKLSILVLGHTPKRNMMDPINENSMGGSKALMNLADSSFAIGRSSKGENQRYLKQIKVRQDAFRYNADSVLGCEIEKVSGFLSLQMVGHSPEWTHLKKPDAKENRNNEIDDKYQAGDSTQKQLAEEYGISEKQINRIIKDKKDEIEDDLPF